MCAKESTRGKKFHHKFKPYIVLQYLLKYTDENNVATARDITQYLQEMDIESERRSIYRDIQEINLISLMLEEDCDIEAAETMLAEDESGDLRLVVYDLHKKGFYIRQRHYELDDIRLLAECVYAAKFVPERQAQRLVEVLCGFVSDYESDRIRHDVFLMDRVKTSNHSVLNSVSIINNAMSMKLDGKVHIPEKIRFHYLKYSFEDMTKQIARHEGKEYMVSPYQFVINDGNYYLLAYNDEKQSIVHYRIDRMKDVRLAGEERTGQEVFRRLDLQNYQQRVFSMYSGRRTIVRLLFDRELLDTMIERFGIHQSYYRKPDDEHYAVETEVEISDQFYGWLAGFGQRVKLIQPMDEVEKFKEYESKLCKYYE